MRNSTSYVVIFCVANIALVSAISLRQAECAEPLVPGRGVQIISVGDDFEDEAWQYIPNNPKSSSDIDNNIREPLGAAKNRRVVESEYRGHPDLVRRVPTPVGGIDGSRGALLLQSVRTGVPGKFSYEQQQDDLMISIEEILGYSLKPSHSPSAVVRVYLPPWDEWEQRTGSSFGFRLDCHAHGKKVVDGLLGQRMQQGYHEYWPGMFLLLRRKQDGYAQTHAQVMLRADPTGNDFAGPIITQPGWVTMGMSITPDGKVHYYLGEGVKDLTEADHIASQFPYDFRCEEFHQIFFNVVNMDDSRTWTTPWVIDDPTIYYIPQGWTESQLAEYHEKKSAQLAQQQKSPAKKIVQISAEHDASAETVSHVVQAAKVAPKGEASPSETKNRSTEHWHRHKSPELRR